MTAVESLPAAVEPWWQAPAPDAKTCEGLSQAEAAEGLATHGANALTPRDRKPLVIAFLLRFRNPLVLVLLAASAISAATGDVTNFAIIMTMVLLSVLLDFVQEHRASQAAERLGESVALRARAVRDGGCVEVPVTAIVPGDVVLLSAGDRIPADGRVLEASDFFVNQGLLTGEAFPAEKHPGSPADASGDLQHATNAAFMGSTVISGSARMLVVATGPATALGGIATSVQDPAPPTAFEIGTQRFGMMVMRITLGLVLFVLLVNISLHRPILESFLFAVALAVGLTPELLPMVISVTLSRGAMRMARRRVIVKRLPAIQNLGAMDVLCTDKTGTLTEAHIGLAQCVDIDGATSERILMLAHLNSSFESGLRSPLDDAILAHPLDVSGWRKVDEDLNFSDN